MFLSPGSTGKLTAWLLGSDGQEHEVSANWTAEGNAISLASNGVVIARQVGGATVHAHYGGHTGTETVHVVTSVAGTWRGSIKVLDCWPDRETSPDPCANRLGASDPLVVSVTQSATGDHLGNLRAVVQVLTPPAAGPFVGLVDSGGVVFLDGHVDRPSDSLSFAFNLRWELKDGTLVPLTSNLDDTMDVLLATRSSPLIHERWQLSTMTR